MTRHWIRSWRQGVGTQGAQVRPFAPDPRRLRWTAANLVFLVAGLTLAGVVRAALLTTDGLRFDLDTFALWTHEIAVGPLSQAYDRGINLPPVMVYVWATLAALQPAFQTAGDASDAAIRVFLKAPASLADLALAIGAVWALRDRPRWAVGAGVAIALHPALVVVSSWWGQSDSLFMVPALIAFLLARSGRPVPAAIALALSLMTKPQALPVLIPFVAWGLQLGARRFLLSAGAFVVTVFLVWAPFLSAGGPAAYLHSVVGAQNGDLAVLSLGAWNLWWLVAAALHAATTQSDAAAILGPLSARLIGLGLAAVGEIAIFRAVWRAPSPRALSLGLACSVLVSFSVLTTMHERYSLAALVFLVPLLPDRQVLITWVALSIAVAANVSLALLPWSTDGVPTAIAGPLSILGSFVILAATVVCLWFLTHDRVKREHSAADVTRLAGDLDL